MDNKINQSINLKSHLPTLSRGANYNEKRNSLILIPCPMQLLPSCKKIDFKIRPDLGCTTFKTSRKVVLDNPPEGLCVYVSACPSVCPSCCIFCGELSRAHALLDRAETLVNGVVKLLSFSKMGQMS